MTKALGWLKSSFNIRFLNTQKIFDFPIEENVFWAKEILKFVKNYSRSKNVLQKKRVNILSESTALWS